MKCTFLGVGSAFDSWQTNVSMLVDGDLGRILLDCGFNSGHACMRMAGKGPEVDALWISHFHGDHFFGVPFLLGGFFSLGRTKDFHICGPCGAEQKVLQLLDLAYPSLLSKLEFKLIFHEFEPGSENLVAGFRMRTCSMDHSASAQALRLDSADGSLFYTGDGRLTPECIDLAEGSGLAILESYTVDNPVKGYSCVQECINFAISAGAAKVGLVHLEPFVRTYHKEQVQQLLARVEEVDVFLPVEGQVLTV